LWFYIYLYLTDVNALTGSIPSEIGGLTELTEFFLSKCVFSDSVSHAWMDRHFLNKVTFDGFHVFLFIRFERIDWYDTI
jgi:hypothetical protein